MLHYQKELIYRDIKNLLDKYEPVPDPSNEICSEDLYDMLREIESKWTEITS